MVASSDAESGQADRVRGHPERPPHQGGYRRVRLGIDPEKVRVLAGDIGGSFGLKIGALAGGARRRRGGVARLAGRSSGSRTAASTWPLPGRPARRASTSGPPSAMTVTCSD